MLPPLDHVLHVCFFLLLLQINLVLNLEEMVKYLNLHLLWFPPIPMRYGPIDINGSNSFSDGYYTTEQEIAEAIKSQAVS